MPITAGAFLEALELPSEHPYLPPREDDRIIVEGSTKEWSVASYFGSWKDSLSLDDSTSPDECDDFPSLSWAKSRFYAFSATNAKDAPRRRSTATAADSQYIASNSFLLEVKPCLVSTLHLMTLLWAPLVILLCLKKLYCKAPLPKLPEQDCTNEALSTEQKSPSAQKQTYFVMPTMPSFPSIPSLRKVTEADEKGRKQNPGLNTGSSFERLLLMASLFFNAMTVVASFSAIFSMEEKKKQPSDEAKHRDESPLFKKYVHSTSIDSIAIRQGPFTFTSEWFAYVLALVFSAVVMNDAMYVQMYPQAHLVALHVFIVSVALKRFRTKVAVLTALPITALAFYYMAHQDLDLPTIEPGLYYAEENPFVSNVVKEWPVDMRTYDDGRGTPWMMTGDTRTGLPFMVNPVPEQSFVRRWVPLPDEEEAVILDIAFPESMVIEDDKRVYLVLHGINGNSNEGYVVDFVHRQVSEGNIVAVMVTRGLGDSTILHDHILHFARTSDVEAAATALKRAIRRVSPRGKQPLLLAGVGYSMGAITLANYVARSNSVDLDAAIAFSGALDTKEQVHFDRSSHLWQPFIAKAMRDSLMSRYSSQITQKLDQEQLDKVMQAESLVDLDRALFVPYHGFHDLDDYYAHLGAMGDYDINGYNGLISHVDIPLLCIQGLDDPVGYWKTYHDPVKVAHSGHGNTMLLFTRTGGHVGWPLGLNPSLEGWRWMSDVASSFAESVDRVRRNNTQR